MKPLAIVGAVLALYFVVVSPEGAAAVTLSVLDILGGFADSTVTFLQALF